MAKKANKGGQPPKDGEEKSKVSNQDKIKELEDLISNTKYNKRTQAAIGKYKAQLARLKEKQEARRSVGKSSGEGYSVRKTGDGTAILLGFPSVGKSTLLNKLTNAKSQTGSYAFTTLTVIPGLLEHKHAKIQVLDVPGIVEGAASGRGRGKEVLAVIQTADLIVILLEVFNPQHYKILLKEVYDTHVRLNQRKPDVKIKKMAKGGIRIGATVPLTHLDKETITNVCKEFRIVNADIVIREDITVDQLIDVIEGNKSYIPSVVVVNKVDMATPEMLEDIKRVIKPDHLISAQQEIGIEELKDVIFDGLKLIRIYLKEVRKKADMEVPLIMIEGCTIRRVCEKLHKDFVEKFKFARVWGTSVKYPGQKLLKLDHALEDGDVLELHIK